MDLRELKQKSLLELMELAKTFGIDRVARARKKEVICAILKAHAKKGSPVCASGIFELLPHGNGFLRAADRAYLPDLDDIYVSPRQIHRLALKTGDAIQGTIRPPKGSERYCVLLKIDKLNFEDPEMIRNKRVFKKWTPLHAKKQLSLEIPKDSTKDLSHRLIHLITPLGRGQRGLIISAPNASKTIMLQNIAHAIATHHPECHLIVLLIDERPEEVTEMARSVRSEVIASTFDKPASQHLQTAEKVIERAKKLVEHKKKVVILLNSITCLGKAYNTEISRSAKVLKEGVDANAVQHKGFFGKACNSEAGGSLTLIATSLVETGSKMDNASFDAFKSTGNMALYLNRRIAASGFYPAINMAPSGTISEELLAKPNVLKKVCILRKLLHPMDDLAGMTFLMDRLQDTPTKLIFFDAMKRATK